MLKYNVYRLSSNKNKAIVPFPVTSIIFGNITCVSPSTETLFHHNAPMTIWYYNSYSKEDDPSTDPNDTTIDGGDMISASTFNTFKVVLMLWLGECSISRLESFIIIIIGVISSSCIIMLVAGGGR